MSDKPEAMTEAHTPTPWVAVNRGTAKEPMWSVMAARIAGRKPGHEVAICATGDSPQDMETANCAYIVLAVNSHARLLKEREELRSALQNLTNDCTASDFNEHWDSHKAARAQLKSKA